MMTTNLSQSHGSTLPVADRGRNASVRALTMTGVVALATGSKSVLVDATPAAGYGHITDVAVLMDAFPGASAWRPPS